MGLWPSYRRGDVAVLRCRPVAVLAPELPMLLIVRTPRTALISAAVTGKIDVRCLAA